MSHFGNSKNKEYISINSDNKLRDNIWEGKDQDYKISDMDIFHVKNCIKMIIDNPGWRDEYLGSLNDRLKYLSEGRWITSPFKRKKGEYPKFERRRK